MKKIEVIYHTCCPCCDGRSWKRFKTIRYHNTKLEYQLCDDCSLLFFNPVPRQDWYNKLYAEEFWEKKSDQKSRSGIIFNEYQWKKEFRKSEKFIDFLYSAGVVPAPGSRILEIGCAYGQNVSTLSEYFNSIPLGVEPSRVASKFAETYSGVEMVAENMDQLDELETDKYVDMFIFSHVMENIVDLNKVFRTIRRLLKPGGLVLMDTPNLIFTTSLHIHHPYSFCIRALSQLFQRKGFEIIKIRASGRPNVVFSPKYLTLLARKQNKAKIIPGIRQKKSTLNEVGIWLGQFWAQVVGRFPLRVINRKLSSYIYSLSPDGLRRLEDLRKKVRSTEAFPQK